MKTSPPKPSLEDVLDLYVSDGPSYDALNEYVRCYPEYRDELSVFTDQWSAMDRAVIEEVSDDDPIAQSAAEAVRRLAGDSTTTKPPPTDADVLPTSLVLTAGGASSAPAESLEDILSDLEIDPFDFEERSGLGYSLLVNLSSGAFTFDSAQERQRVARALQNDLRAFGREPLPSITALERSVSGPLQIVFGAACSPTQKPEVSMKSFRRAIEDAHDMTVEAKRKWLRILDETY